MANIAGDVSKLFLSNRIKFLFFGNLRKVKGIDILVDYIRTHKDKMRYVEIVIAGKNVENIDFSDIKTICHVIDRHITDDELKYLYSKTDYVLLPYRDSSQSGILEMAFCFRKPMLLSNIPYFDKILSQFPSFGEMENIEEFSILLDRIINNGGIKKYYSEIDCDKFLMKKEIERFKREFTQSIA